MAKATRKPPVTKVVTVAPGGVNLELTEDEAEMILAITGKFIAGGLVNPIHNALRRAGVIDRKYDVREWDGSSVSYRGIRTLKLVSKD